MAGPRRHRPNDPPASKVPRTTVVDPTPAGVDPWTPVTGEQILNTISVPDSPVPDVMSSFSDSLSAVSSGIPDGAMVARVVRLSLATHMEPAAATALEQAVGRAQLPRQRGEIRLWLSRLYRKMGWTDRAAAHLRGAVADSGSDPKVRRSHAIMAARAGDYSAMAALLGELARKRASLEMHRSAWRMALMEGAIRSERLKDMGAAAWAFAQAAEYATAFGEPGLAFDALVLSARAHKSSAAAPSVLAEALHSLEAAGKAAGRQEEAAKIVKELSPPPKPVPKPNGAVSDPHGDGSEAADLRTESQLIGKGRWKDLADFYRSRSATATNPQAKSLSLSRLAELLAEELADPGGAADAYGQIVTLVGDPAALAAQLRILEETGDTEGHVRAVEAAADWAPDPRAKCEAYLARGERLLKTKQFRSASADFERARKIDPGSLRALMGMAESRAAEGDGKLIPELEKALSRLPRGSPGRGALYRRIAHLYEWPVGDLDRCRAAWTEVIDEDPGDTAAEEKLAGLARTSGDSVLLATLLRRKIARDPRGPGARDARHELATTLEKAGKLDEAFEEWQMAARVEPGDSQALLAVAERAEFRGQFSQAATAIEGAALATVPGPERAGLWLRLGKLCREKLKDEARAEACEARAKTLTDPTDRVPTPLSTPALPPAAPPPTGESPIVRTPEPVRANTQRDLSAPIRVITSGDIMVDDAAPTPRPTDSRSKSRSQRRSSKRLKKAEAAEPAAPKKRLTEEHYILLNAVRDSPLDPARYRDLAVHFRKRHNAEKIGLLMEVSAALEGEAYDEPAEPKGTLTPAELLSLRHRELRGPLVEFLDLAGLAMAGLHVVTGRDAGKGRFSENSGRGAPATAKALLTTVRYLGIRAPQVALSEDEGPPLSTANTDPPSLLVGKVALRRAMSLSELRFFAGRALYTLQPEILSLRALTEAQISRGLVTARQALAAGAMTPEAKQMLKRMPRKARPRMIQLLDEIKSKSQDIERLREAARYAANRAGLLAAGSVGPALAALRAKRAADDELAELVTFAASDKYLTLRSNAGV
jgi:cellulose synthase operon protein C